MAASGQGEQVAFMVSTDPPCPVRMLTGMVNPHSLQHATTKARELMWPKAGRTGHHNIAPAMATSALGQ